MALICVEADEAYVPLLRWNTAGLGVVLHHIVTGAATADAYLSFKRTTGTSAIVAGGERRQVVALDDLISEKPGDLVKIDTDGYEAQVLRGLTRTLDRSGPPVFIEFDPRHLMAHGKVRPSVVGELLKSAGYTCGIVYYWLGYPMMLTDLTDSSIRYLANYCLARPDFYVDILVGKDRDMLFPLLRSRFCPLRSHKELGSR